MALLLGFLIQHPPGQNITKYRNVYLYQKITPIFLLFPVGVYYIVFIQKVKYLLVSTIFLQYSHPKCS